MAVLDSNTLKAVLPRQISDKMITQTKSLSTVAQLSGTEPMRFGEIDFIKFNDTVRAEFVEENAEKSPTSAGWEKVTAVPHKAQVTIRTSNEFLWADEDYQLAALSQVADAGAKALSRALDLGLYHRINPLTGNTVDSWTNYLTATTNVVTQAEGVDADADIRNAAGLIVSNGFSVNGLALDPKEAWALANLQALSAGKGTGQPRYPQLGLGTDITSFLGLNTAVGNTVSGVPEATDTKVRAIVGDFADGIRWGIQRDLPLEVIPYGDPDGQGDLKRKNQIAIRLELVYAWYVLTERFAVVKAGA